MKLCQHTQAPIAFERVLQYKQRLVALSETFEADIAACLARGEEGWSLLGLYGTLAEGDWRGCLPYRALRATLREGKGVLCADFLGPDQDFQLQWFAPTLLLCTISSMPTEDLCLVIGRPLKRGIFRPRDLELLGRMLAAFEDAG